MKIQASGWGGGPTAFLILPSVSSSFFSTLKADTILRKPSKCTHFVLSRNTHLTRSYCLSQLSDHTSCFLLILFGHVGPLTICQTLQVHFSLRGSATATLGFPGGSVVKNLPAKQETWVWSQVSKIPWKRKWQPLQYSCLGNSMDRGARRPVLFTGSPKESDTN